MKFPKTLSKAILDLSRSKVKFRSVDLEQSDLVHYNAFKSHYQIESLTPATLRSLYRSGLYKIEISKLFKKNKNHAYLGVESRRKSRFHDSPINS